MQEGDQNLQNYQQQGSDERTKVSFPQRKPNGSNKGIFIVIAVIVILLGGGIWFLLSGGDEEPISEDISPTPVEEEAPTPTQVELNKSEVRIEVLNGTSISGEASKLETVLSELGYSDIEVGNADSSDNEATEVNFSSSVTDNIKEEIVSELESIYADVSVKDSFLDELDVRIIIGYRKGYTPAPKATNAPTKTPTPTTSVTPSPTITPTPTNTPTPTP